MQSDIRPVVKHASFFSKDGCSKPSATFIVYAYNFLNNQSIVKAVFNSCDFIPQLQVALNYTSVGALININAGIIGNKLLLLKSATDFWSIISPTSLKGIGECCISK